MKTKTHKLLEILATDAALVIRVYWKSLEKELFNLFYANIQLAFIVDSILIKHVIIKNILQLGYNI